MRFDTLTLFGVIALTIMVACYALEKKSPWYTFGMAVCCIAASAYAFLAGTWPFGILEGLWAGIAFFKWRAQT